MGKEGGGKGGGKEKGGRNRNPGKQGKRISMQIVHFPLAGERACWR